MDSDRDDRDERSDAADAGERLVSADDREWATTERGDHEFRRVKLGAAAGGDQLGCSLYEVPAGKEAWPYHFHTGNEEALYVLAGEGVLRTPDGETGLEPGDYAAFPTGEESAHAIRNDGEEALRFLAVSTMNDPDVLGYPDSEKVGVYAGSPPGGDPEERVLSGFFPRDATVDFWEGEE